MEDIKQIAKDAKNTYLKMMNLSCDLKNSILKKIANALEEKKFEILEKNKIDIDSAKILLEEGKINKPTFERLKLSQRKIEDLIQGLNDLVLLEDPINKVLWTKELDEGLVLRKITTPIGVIGVIFEARPDCFIQIASLIIKSGNCGILKGGSECRETNTIFSKIVEQALFEIDPELKSAIKLIYSREDVKNLLDLDEYISLIIPRGGNKLVKFIKENTKIPVLGHASGICHIFLDKEYDFESAKKIIIDAKTQYPSACNAVETLLIHKDFEKIDELEKELENHGIKIEKKPKSFSLEYGDKILSLKVVDSLDCAISHINKYGSGHTDSILSDNKENIEKFMNLVDSACVFSNCSTRFSDGFRFGFGAEVGISTNKTHARGPVGLEGLTIYKYKLLSNGAIVKPYADGEKKFHHKLI